MNAQIEKLEKLQRRTRDLAYRQGTNEMKWQKAYVSKSRRRSCRIRTNRSRHNALSIQAILRAAS